ncbi:type IV secretion system protein [Cupriavidus pinatubonensis]|uniref:type IV secretion system protein n=1 Tax=Cupriavidus pinatubonensis TaxID=248026 RepID=UPI001127BFC5|nr:type IV secretion system protein [Cupriavidus pinatubonensis]TPQ30478.1 type VI secretion protein [Cupriavidus pinatubonensis]
MPLFSRSNQAKKDLSPAPGMYAGDDVTQFLFDRTARVVVERNHWKLAALVAALIAVAAVMTRQPPEPVVRVVGVSGDANGKPVARELEAYQPKSLEIQVAFRDLVTRMFTIEPVLTAQIEESRIFQNMNSAKKQMVGAAREQFEKWLSEDAPFRSIAQSPTLVREVQVTNIALLPDNTVAVEFVTSTRDEGSKPRRQRYAMTFRYQIDPPKSDAALTANPFGIYPVFFSIQKSAA